MQHAGGTLKEPGPITSLIFLKLWEKKACIFLINPGEFYGWKMYCLEDTLQKQCLARKHFS